MTEHGAAPDEQESAGGSAGRAVVVTVSTRAAAGVYSDDAGPAVAEQLRGAGFVVAQTVVVPDGRTELATVLRDACADADLVVTNGGTGLTPNDLTPEATLDIIDRPAPGFAEAMRANSLQVTPMAMLSRATAGILGRTLVLNLPGSPRGAVENLAVVLPALGHAVDQLRGGDHARQHPRHPK